MLKSLLILRAMDNIQPKLKSALHDFEKMDHLVLRPPVGTPVVLIKDIDYLREYHSASIGQVGTVIDHSRLTTDDNGVLVEWGVRPNNRVRMDLEEIKLSPDAFA